MLSIQKKTYKIFLNQILSLQLEIQPYLRSRSVRSLYNQRIFNQWAFFSLTNTWRQYLSQNVIKKPLAGLKRDFKITQCKQNSQKHYGISRTEIVQDEDIPFN